MFVVEAKNSEIHLQNYFIPTFIRHQTSFAFVIFTYYRSSPSFLLTHSVEDLTSFLLKQLTAASTSVFQSEHQQTLDQLCLEVMFADFTGLNANASVMIAFKLGIISVIGVILVNYLKAILNMEFINFIVNLVQITCVWGWQKWHFGIVPN